MIKAFALEDKNLAPGLFIVPTLASEVNLVYSETCRIISHRLKYETIVAYSQDAGKTTLLKYRGEQKARTAISTASL